MANNPTHKQQTKQPTLRLAGDGRIGALTPARPAPVPVSVLQVEDPAAPARAAARQADEGQPAAIPFQARAAMVAGGHQEAIRTKLVAGCVPGAILYRVP